jgi:hypothetical protein
MKLNIVCECRKETIEKSAKASVPYSKKFRYRENSSLCQVTIEQQLSRKCCSVLKYGEIWPDESTDP